jgi:hypothetical protein
VPFESLVFAEPGDGIKVAQNRASKRFSTISAHPRRPGYVWKRSKNGLKHFGWNAPILLQKSPNRDAIGKSKPYTAI